MSYYEENRSKLSSLLSECDFVDDFIIKNYKDNMVDITICLKEFKKRETPNYAELKAHADAGENISFTYSGDKIPDVW